jgi:hypothetical protein
MKKKTKKKPVKVVVKKIIKKSTKKKIVGEKTILNFLEVEKDTEMFFRDVLKKKSYVLWNDNTERFSVHGKKKFAEELGISVSVLNRLIKTGFNKKDEARFRSRIARMVNELELSGYEISSTVNMTKYFNRDNFSFDSFNDFFRKYKKKVTGDERLLFRAQIYAKMNKGYIIPEFNFSLYSLEFNSGVYEFYRIIRKQINSWQSMAFFYFIFLVCEKHKIREI